MLTPDLKTPAEQALCICVLKSAGRLILTTSGGERSYEIDSGKNRGADKVSEGDLATPIGEFYVCAKNPLSRFLRSLCLSYPNAEDAKRGLADGLITPLEHRRIIEAIRLRRVPPQTTRLGGEIYIHGGRDSKRGTRGCIALDDAAILDLFECTPLGTPVLIEP
ncbi:MAG: L,D-transpeptidase [Pseudomonadota bacterium]|nr:L,D-transpeptidase [Pseudomonadota bacterium]